MLFYLNTAYYIYAYRPIRLSHSKYSQLLMDRIDFDNYIAERNTISLYTTDIPTHILCGLHTTGVADDTSRQRPNRT